MSRLTKILIALALIITVFAIVLFIPSEDSMALEGTKGELEKEIIMYIGSSTALVQGSERQIDELDKEITPVELDGVKLVPVRFIAEALGAQVGWDSKTKMVSIKRGNKTIKFKHGSDTIDVVGTQIKLDKPIQTIGERTFVPLTQFAMVLGKDVFYNNGLIIIGNEKDFPDPTIDKSLINLTISRINRLPTVDSYDAFKKLFEDSNYTTDYYKREVVMGSLDTKMNEMTLSAEASKSTEASKSAEAAIPPAAPTNQSGMPVADSSDAVASGDYSTTNVQVQGVDEADIVKTDGQYIYQVNKQRIVIAKAYPSKDMEIQSIINFKDSSFNPIELYLHEQKMIVIGTASFDYYAYDEKVDGIKAEDKNSFYRTYQPTVRILVYDIADKSLPHEIRKVEVEGNYISSRKTGSNLYLVSNRYFDYYYIQEDENIPTPSYRDSLKNGELISIDYKAIQYFPGVIQPNYLIVAGLNLDAIDEKMEVSTYLGAGQNIYASQDSLYIAVTGWEENIQPDESIQPREVTSTPKLAVMPRFNDYITKIYKFALDSGKVVYIGKGEVPGTILNQFSMDEYDGHFRIATTKGEIWRNDEHTSQNNVYVLNEMLNITGMIENIAPGERIYSVRFMGKKGYVVTFKTVDPLFVLDLENPENPSILGALKIPGYSDYLHPYDENHIIGFGKDTIEIKGQAYYLGMKIAMFDVTDVTKPKQMFSEFIGDRGTDSELLRDHKALMFSKQKGLMAFPVTVMEVMNKTQHGEYERLQYGEFAFQGAYVYSVDLVNGFNLKGKITHISEQDYLKSGNNWYDSNRNIQRILYIDDTLYTLSNGMYKAHGISDMKEKNELIIPE